MSQAFITHITAEIETAYEEAQRACGLSDVMFDARFQEACEGLLARVPAEHRAQALVFAKAQGYDPDYDPDQGFDPGACSMTGVDENCCPCGRHP